MFYEHRSFLDKDPMTAIWAADAAVLVIDLHCTLAAGAFIYHAYTLFLFNSDRQLFSHSDLLALNGP